MWCIIGVSYLVFFSVSAQLFDDLPIVSINQGTVVGSRATDGDYLEFHGIPYADSTSGLNRFKAPSAPPSFEDVFVANRKNIKCVRALDRGFEGTEDCLVANIFTPSINNTNPIPVMVWVKGKELNQIPEPGLSVKNFMEKDVVIVSLNYRESILGFLCLGTESAPGNAGLKDIVAGLRWVRDNILQFGGDPDNISIFGHGSGAASVDLVSLSSMSEGLIHKVITQSGTALSPWAVTRNNIKYAVDVAEALGHEVTNIEQLSDIFTRTSIAALMAVINELDLTDNSLAFAPCLEKENLEGGEPFLLKSPYEILMENTYRNVPFMAGFVDKEGTIRAEEALEYNWLERMDESFIDFIQPDLYFENSQVENAIVNDIKHFYFGEEPIDNTKINEYLTYHGDTMILVSTLREARMRAATMTEDIYLYQFSYKGLLGKPFAGPLLVDHAAHSEELAYLFRNYSNPEALDMDLAVSDILIERWTNFAKTGIPISESSQIEWRPFTREHSYYLRFLDSDEVTRERGALEIELEDPHAETLSFWEQIYEEHFLDAESRWNIIDRTEGDSGEEGSGEEGSGEEGSGVENGNGEEEEESKEEEDGGEVEGGGDGEGGSEEEDSGEEGDSEEDDSNSASTAIGYTFLIVSLFSILNKLHISQLIS